MADAKPVLGVPPSGRIGLGRIALAGIVPGKDAAARSGHGAFALGREARMPAGSPVVPGSTTPDAVPFLTPAGGGSGMIA